MRDDVKAQGGDNSIGSTDHAFDYGQEKYPDEGQRDVEDHSLAQPPRSLIVDRARQREECEEREDKNDHIRDAGHGIWLTPNDAGRYVQ
jgi:hypothetical protein